MTAIQSAVGPGAGDAHQAQTHSRLMVLLFTDVVGSTELKNRLGTVEYAELLGRHDRIFRQIIAQRDGSRILKDTGDGFFVSFATASDAVRAALLFQQELARQAAPLRTRVGLHVGEVAEIDHDESGRPKVVGLAADFAARLMSLADGAQVLLTRFAFNEARQFVRAHPILENEEPMPLRWVAHGEYVFKGYPEPVEVFEVGAVGIAPLAPPADNDKAHRNVRPGDEVTLGWRPAGGLELRDRPNWIIKEKLGEGGFGEVWLAEHAKTGMRRVMKFCFEPERLRGLKREVVLFRLLKEALGERRDIARIVDFQFDQSPYFIETQYFPAGTLQDWAAKQGGLARVPLETRIRIVADIADALAAAHSVGILHKDIKPSNILMADDGEGNSHPVLTDFGIGILTDRSALARHDITVVGFTENALTTNESSRTGTRMYAPPESLLNKPFTVQGDVYALGVLLYQMVIADLSRPLAEGWERLVTDELLRDDIAACVEGEPAHRLASAKELSDRLRNLAGRRRERERAAAATRTSERRRKLVAAMSIGLVLALAGLVGLWIASSRIKREAAKSAAVTDFLRDMLTMADPARGNRPNMTVREMLDRASQTIDAAGGSTDPSVEAAIRGAIGRTYLTLGLYPAARKQLADAVKIMDGLGQSSDLWAMKYTNDLAVAQMYESNYSEAEKQMLELLQTRTKALGPDHPDTADSLINLANLNIKMQKWQAAEGYAKQALAVREKLGSETAPVAAAQQALALIYIGMGRYDAAEAPQLKAIAIREKVLAPNHFELANSYNNLGLLYMNRNRTDDAEQAFAKSLSIFEKSVDPEHPFAAQALSNLAAIKLRKGDFDAAKPYADRALAIQEKLLGPEHPDIVQSILAVATVHYARQELDEAQRMFERAFALAEKHFGPTDQKTLHAEVSLGFVCRDAHKFELARKYLPSARDKLRAAGDVSRAMQTQTGLIEGIIWEGKLDEAEPMADALLADARGLADQALRDRFTADAMQLQIAIYDKSGRAASASALRKQLGIAEPTTEPATAPSTAG